MIYKYKNWFLIALFSLPILVFFILFFRFGLNIPFEDDLGIVHTLAVELPKALTFKEKVATFTMAHNEHPIAVFRFFLWVYYLLTDTYNFKVIAFVGNIILLSTIYYFFRQLRIITISWKWLIPIPFIMLSLYIHENALWALCAFQHNAIMGLYFWGLYHCVIERKRSIKFFFGIFLIVCTSICSGNGLLGFIIVSAILLFEKRWINASVVIGIFLLTKLLLLNTNYYKEPRPLVQIIKGFFLLSGSLIKVASKDNLIIIVGIIAMITTILAGIRLLFGKLSPQERTYYLLGLGVNLFCLGTFVGVAVYREVDSSGFSDRYRIYTQMLWISIYLFSVPIIIKYSFQRWVYPAIVALSFGYFSYSYYAEYANLVYAYQQRWLIAVNYRYGGTNLSGCYYRTYFDETLQILEKRKEYILPEPKFNPSTIEKTNLKIDIKAEKPTTDAIYFHSDNGEIVGNPDTNALFIVLENVRGTQLFIPLLHKRNSIGTLIKEKKVLKKGFEIAIFKGCLPDDMYKVTLVKLTNKKAQQYITNLVIDSKDFTFEAQ